MENPFVKYWLWYYDVLWRYWPIVVVLTIIAVWLVYRRYTKRQREWDERMEKSRKETEDFKRQVYENDIVNVDLSKIKRIDRFEYDCVHFHVIIEDGKLTFTDKETGDVFEKLTGQKAVKLNP
jgi:hypothetical protein